MANIINDDLEAETTDGRSKQTAASPEKKRCCKTAVLFDRSLQSFWNPRFDSNFLETYYGSISSIQTRQSFRYALVYLAVSSLIWAVYFCVQRDPSSEWLGYLAGAMTLLVVSTLLLILSYLVFFRDHIHIIAVVTAIILCVVSLVRFGAIREHAWSIGGFVFSLEVIILLYTFLPLPLYACFGIGFLYSIVHELLSATMTSMSCGGLVVGRGLVHVAVHLLGLFLFIMTQVRRRSTFLKVGQSIKARGDLEVEKQTKQNMIHSLMPPSVADEVMKSREKGPEMSTNEDDTKNVSIKSQLTFRSFHMSKMEEVSILFADIVGFTKMSSNKTAEHLVMLLNDLFGRFDSLCSKNNCEKISTLGDCYYCVSGCPEPRKDHAQCCVEMGLAMCVAIMQFDEDHKEEVNMRVGVHTGTVLCGLVGTRRFKFDVWSHDVTLANTMESEGQPGRVHVSEHTYQYIKDSYIFEKGETVPDIRGHKTLIECFNAETQQYVVQHVEKQSSIETWFIVDRIKEKHLNNLNCAENGVRDKADIEALQSRFMGSKENASVAAKEQGDGVSVPGAYPLLPKLAEKVADQKMIQFMKECNNLETYLFQPPIHPCLLRFSNSRLESDYKNHFSTIDKASHRTLAFPRIGNLADAVVCVVFYLLVSMAAIVGLVPKAAIFYSLFVFGLLYQSVMLGCAVLGTVQPTNSKAIIWKITNMLSSWIPRHLIQIIALILPIAVAISAFACRLSNNTDLASLPSAYLYDHFYAMLVVSALFVFCNFTILASWVKTGVAVVGGLVLIVLFLSNACGCPFYVTIESLNISVPVFYGAVYNDTDARINNTLLRDLIPLFYCESRFSVYLTIVVILALLLIALINYDTEIGYRLCYHGDVQAVKDKKKIEDEKEMADWLLHNIVPEHVANLLKTHEQYCKNHKDVGIIFAKISNFDDFYDESYEGGKEYLRVLNELIGDFEELFDVPKFKDVEKIKTIGSCLMAASGLDPDKRSRNKDPNTHLYALLDFAIEMLKKLKEFNRDIFNFEFELKIGFNAGEVTAGVIGSQKLLYDIWGDAVNISSRMYSTGEHDRIQVTEEMAHKLGDKFDFEYREETFVKGKGMMRTYLLVGKKEGASWE